MILALALFGPRPHIRALAGGKGGNPSAAAHADARFRWPGEDLGDGPPLGVCGNARRGAYCGMQPKLFRPTARQINWLLIVGFLALGEALYLRYLAIEHAPVSLACQGGLKTWLCATFRLTITLYNHSVFGWVALAAALLNLMRPSIVLVAVALAAAAFGLVLHNANLAGLAVALLLLSLARPAPAAE